MSTVTQVTVLFYAAIVCSVVCFAGVSAGYFEFAVPLVINGIAVWLNWHRLCLLRGENEAR